MTPAPEQAKGNIWIATEEPIKIKSQGVILVAEDAIYGTIVENAQLQCTDRRTGQLREIQCKGMIILDPDALKIKGYSEFIIDGRKIKVGVEGLDVISEKNLAGYYAVHKDDLKALINAQSK